MGARRRPRHRTRPGRVFEWITVSDGSNHDDQSPVTTSTTSQRVTTTTLPKPTPTPRSSTTTTTAAADPMTVAINAFQAAQGPARGWVISSTQASAVDPSYILFKLDPAPGYETSYQGGYGFVQHQASGAWSVIGSGTSAWAAPLMTQRRQPCLYRCSLDSG
jgi:hypothetical protein